MSKNSQIFDFRRKKETQTLKVQAFRKRLLYPVELWGHSFTALFDLSGLSHFASLCFTQVHQKTWGKLGENRFSQNESTLSDLEIIIAYFINLENINIESLAFRGRPFLIFGGLNGKN